MTEREKIKEVFLSLTDLIPTLTKHTVVYIDFVQYSDKGDAERCMMRIDNKTKIQKVSVLISEDIINDKKQSYEQKEKE